VVKTPKNLNIQNNSVGFTRESTTPNTDTPSTTELKPIIARKPIKNKERKQYLKLLRESQEYLNSKFDAFDKDNDQYQAKVRNGVSKYLNKMGYIDRCINIDLNTLGHL